MASQGPNALRGPHASAQADPGAAAGAGRRCDRGAGGALEPMAAEAAPGAAQEAPGPVQPERRARQAAVEGRDRLGLRSSLGAEA